MGRLGSCDRGGVSELVAVLSEAGEGEEKRQVVEYPWLVNLDHEGQQLIDIQDLNLNLNLNGGNPRK